MGNVEIPDWLTQLPLAPEFRPTDTEFADPIAYISKIEKEASAFGICKIIPPLPKPSKRYVFYNLNKSLVKCPELGSDINTLGVCNYLKMNSGDSCSDGKMRAVFTTRQQELGQSMKKTKEGVQSPLSGVHKQVWQSGEIYTLEQFESKSKDFARSVLGVVKEVSPLAIEAMFWKAASGKPIYVEYANDVPGSAFGEPKGQSHLIHKRKRRKGYYKRNLASSDGKKTEMDSTRDANTDETKDNFPQNQVDTCLRTSESTAALSTLSSHEGSRSSWQKSSDASNEMEGTAGWKLSSSPWNLQVIARSPGSLTRFMPDDIPGVTSPMIYIGMLFSWFAWHVEDHELHSMNFLHSGAPKTWYAVPGDNAFAFEEVIRSEAYGGKVDNLATLTLLGEKTTLLSPEVVVMSGIPCCRLIQNPGEFVVTFPRAYHVGFSHGFNCGEAANFGTPQWLKVAKEAAVRRAAMNYLPMLSHQQLLYLLTMSFIGRVPRSLLPGVRSSRLKDRQKEERELLVKKAFIEDVLYENSLLSILLEKESTHHTVLWNADLLPDSSKHSQMPDLASTSETSVVDMSNINSADKSSHDQLFDLMSLSMDNLTDLSLGDDDLPFHFQTDSGALACIGCGILGFPFMAVVQPSKRSLMESLPVNRDVLKDSSPDSNVPMQGSVLGNLLSVSDHPSEKEVSKLSLMKFDMVQNPSSKYLRPRIFCLEHALQIVEMLHSKGGAKVLVICHSDYQKINAHARAVAEEIGSAFDYNEVPLDVASSEDLTLIDLAIDGEELDECEEDWTSKLGVNLRYCVKARKILPSKHVPYALALGILFSDKGHSSEFLSIKWQSRRCRSKKLKHLGQGKACDGTQTKKDDPSGRRIALANCSIAKNKILFQYSRRKFKSKQGCSSRRSMPNESHEKSKIVSFVLSVDHNNHVSKDDLDTEDSRSDCVLSCISTSTGISEMQHETRTADVANSMSLNTATSQLPNSFPCPRLMDGGAGVETGSRTMEEREIDGKNTLSASNLSKMHCKISASEICTEENQISYKRKHPCSITVATGKRFETLRKNQTTEIINTSSKCDCVDLDDNKHQQFESTHTTNKEEAASSTVSSVNQPTLASVEGCFGSPKKNYGAESNSNAMSFKQTTELEIITLDKNDKDPILHYGKPLNKHIPNGEDYEVPVKLSAADLYDPVALDVEVQEDVQIAEGNNREINLPYQLLVKQRCEKPKGKQAEGLNEVILDSEKQHQDQIKNKISEVPAPSYVPERETESITVSEVICSNVSREACLKGKSSTQFISYRRRDPEIQPRSKNDDEVRSGTEISQMESSVSNQECFTTEKETYYIGKNETEIHLSRDNRELEGSELTTLASRSDAVKKRKREVNRITRQNFSCYGFARSPCEGLRPRAGKIVTGKSRLYVKETQETKTERKHPDVLVSHKNKNVDVKRSHKCNIEGCGMSFTTKAELQLHKRNRCPHEGCGKKFSTHKYALIHQRVHEDVRPFKCPWKGCSMSFKWAWARTEHIRVHTGEKPYKCKVEGCGLSFRFVSDYSRHRRKTGHYV